MKEFKKVLIPGFENVDERDFINYLTKDKKPPITDKKTLKRYIAILKKYFADDVESMEDYREICYEVEKGWNHFAKAVRNYLHYLVDRDMLDEDIEPKLLKVVKIKPSGTREVYPSDDDIRKGLELIANKWDEDTLLLYKFIVFTGTRLSQALRALKTFDSSHLKFEDNIAYYPMTRTTRGHKKAYLALMPAEFAKKLRKISLTYSQAQDRLNPRKWKPPLNLMIDANAIRKWFDNFVVENEVPESISDFIQGRSSVTVGSKHYLNKIKQAKTWYKKIVDKFPIPP